MSDAPSPPINRSPCATAPRLPSTRIGCPVWNSEVADLTPTTQGLPSSRAMIAACDETGRPLQVDITEMPYP